MISFIIEQVWGSVPEWLQALILVFLILSYLIGHMLANTKTPPPNTTWGRIYAGLEIFANLYGKAKDVGIPLPEKPSVDDLLARISELETSLKSQPAPVSPAVVMATIPQGDQPNA